MKETDFYKLGLKTGNLLQITLYTGEIDKRILAREELYPGKDGIVKVVLTDEPGKEGGIPLTEIQRIEKREPKYK